MTDYKEKYKEEKIFRIIVMIISVLAVIFLSMNIKLRDERIWQLEVENQDLKEQIYRLEKNKE